MLLVDHRRKLPSGAGKRGDVALVAFEFHIERIALILALAQLLSQPRKPAFDLAELLRVRLHLRLDADATRRLAVLIRHLVGRQTGRLIRWLIRWLIRCVT